MARTRRLLEDAFRSLMIERPSCDMSVGEVAERACVSRATFYGHFEDMRHLATTVLKDDLWAAMRERVPDGTAFAAESVASAAAAVYEFFDAFFRSKHRTTGERDLVIGATLQETILLFFDAWLSEEPRAVRLFLGSSRESAVTALSWTIYGGALRWSRLSYRAPADQAARQIVELLIR